MEKNQGLTYRKALEDFYSARGKASIEELAAWISGQSRDLLPYDEVRRRLQGVESAERTLTEIPLDAIVGSVSRPADFTRSLLPLRVNDSERWARVKALVEGMSGLPPIEVYRVGEAYFIIDGHHRASVAREMGHTHIEAYVRPVHTLVPLTPGDDLETTLLKAEFAEFLEKTHLDRSRPDADLSGTLAGETRFFLDQIAARRARPAGSSEPSFEEAAAAWYDEVYLPVVQVIRSRNLRRRFSDRTEADLYYYIMTYRERSEQELGWKVTPRDAVENMTFHYARNLDLRLARLRKTLYRVLMPEPLEPSVPPGFWRRQRRTAEETVRGLFDSILVALPGTESSWNALDAALFLAHNEHAALNGLHIVAAEEQKNAGYIEPIRRRFARRCEQAGIEGRMAVEVGHPIPRVMYERSFWVDLLVIPLSFPPPLRGFKRLGSGIRMLIRRSAAPLLFVPPNAPPVIRRALVAYGGGRMAEEALAMAAYLCLRFTIDLTVITIDAPGKAVGELQSRAQAYLESMGITVVHYMAGQGDPAPAILNACRSTGSDVVLMGGYEGGLLKELLAGSTVDRVLRGADRAVMVCR